MIYISFRRLRFPWAVILQVVRGDPLSAGYPQRRGGDGRVRDRFQA